ncbi:NAD(P)-binding oxidoreductase [Streptomyces incanus]|uniref:NAD(P)-binding oxidoreductase n=1 Tax=Streptomyces incanus TaxID=887453 RepID=A0ABW0XNT9_9ACTN
MILAIRSMDAAKEAGVDRYVMVSYLRARAGHGVATDDPFYPYIESKKAADEHLRGSGLDYTILAPDVLSLDEPTGRIDRVIVPADRTTVPRADVAAVAAAVLTDPTTIGRTIGFRAGGTPIAEAIHG